MSERIKTIALAIITGMLIVLLLTGCMYFGERGDKNKSKSNHDIYASSVTQP